MPQPWKRSALAMFALLSTAFAVNVFVFQPEMRSFARSQSTSVAELKVEMPSLWSRLRTSRGEADKPPAEAWSLQLATHRPDSSDEPAAAAQTLELTRAIQRELNGRGYETGADGATDIVTRAAIMAFEADSGLPLTAEPSEGLLQSLLLGVPAGPSGSDTAEARPGPNARMVTRLVQQSLRSLGYRPGVMDGRMSKETEAAIRSFEQGHGMSASGRVSGQLLSRLAQAAGSPPAAR